jgi:hypothetical protein
MGCGREGVGEYRNVGWNKIWSWDVREEYQLVKMHKNIPKIHAPVCTKFTKVKKLKKTIDKHNPVC